MAAVAAETGEREEDEFPFLSVFALALTSFLSSSLSSSLLSPPLFSLLLS
jgi:hypothetical protein